jgi:hypothetical protein
MVQPHSPTQDEKRHLAWKATLRDRTAGGEVGASSLCAQCLQPPHALRVRDLALDALRLTCRGPPMQSHRGGRRLVSFPS